MHYNLLFVTNIPFFFMSNFFTFIVGLGAPSGPISAGASGGTTFDRLKYLSAEDIKDTIRSIGLRAQFREKLFIWRKQKYSIEDETLSIQSKVLSWLKSIAEPTGNSSSFNNTLTSTTEIDDCPHAFKDLNSLLKTSNRGRAILSFYEKDSGILLLLENVVQLNNYGQ